MSPKESSFPPPASRAPARWPRRALFGVLGAALVAFLVLLWRTPPLAVDVTEVSRGPLEVTIDEAGRARVIDRYTIAAPLAGELVRIAVHPSDRVAGAEPVAHLLAAAAPLLDARARSVAEARVAAARAQWDAARIAAARARDLLAFAGRETERRRALVRAGALPARELEVAELDERSRRADVRSASFAARIAEHELRGAEAALGQLAAPVGSSDPVPITSPIEGVVLRVLAESAGPVAAGTPLLEVGDPAALEVVADLLTSDAVQVRAGAEVELDRWGGEAVLRGRVRRVEPAAFTRVSALGVEEQRVNAIIDLEGPREGWAALGDGYRVEVHVVVWRSESVLRVPASAVFQAEDGWCTFAVEEGRARRRALALGHRGRALVEVLSGLDEGARVIEYPGEGVEDGVAVAPR